MTRYDIIKLAREANPGVQMGKFPDDIALIFERFAALVAAAEREACARALDEQDLQYASDLIRSRGQA